MNIRVEKALKVVWYTTWGFLFVVAGGYVMVVVVCAIQGD